MNIFFIYFVKHYHSFYFKSYAIQLWDIFYYYIPDIFFSIFSFNAFEMANI